MSKQPTEVVYREVVERTYRETILRFPSNDEAIASEPVPDDLNAVFLAEVAADQSRTDTSKDPPFCRKCGQAHWRCVSCGEELR